VHWAKTYLSKAQLVEATRCGHFRITARGQTVLQAQPTYIDNKFLMQFEQFRQFRERSIGGAEEGSQTIIPAPDDKNRRPMK
jgi:restriction system protein